MLNQLNCFKAYDIRGRLPDVLNEDIAWRIGRAYAEYFNPDTVVVGGDARLSTNSLKESLKCGLRSAGVNVLDIGLCGTEEIYFATFNLNLDGGIMVTASHNPKDYNGFKMVQHNAKPVGLESGLNEIKSIAEKLDCNRKLALTGFDKKLTILDDYICYLKRYIDITDTQSVKIVVNAGNGTAGHVIDALEEFFNKNSIPIEFIKIHHTPDGNFPNGVPNPLLKENRLITSTAVKNSNADLGIAWDGDFDRCFFFDENGDFIEGYYIVGLLAKSFLSLKPGEKIIHDPRLIWNTEFIVQQSGGISVMTKTGHSFIKEKMRKENAIYGGEMSAHHYFRDFAYCDSGMIPWLLMVDLLSKSKKKLSELVFSMMESYPTTGELNIAAQYPDKIIKKVLDHFKKDAKKVDKEDGVSMEFESWRFNLRKSNTEDLIRLNIEARKDKDLLHRKKN